MNKTTLHALAVALICAHFLVLAQAAPAITSVTGQVEQGSSIGITGTGFGTKTNASPFYWDDFETKIHGQSALAAGLDDLGYDGQGLPYVRSTLQDNNAKALGVKALQMDYPLNKNSLFPRLGKAGLNTAEVYVSVWTYLKRTAGFGMGFPILKLVRAGTNPPYGGVPRFYETVRPDSAGKIVASDRGSVDSNGSTTWTQDVNKGQDADGWHRTEYYFKLSTPGVTDGVFQSWVDGIQNVNLQDTMSRQPSSTALINYVMSPFDGNDSYGMDNAYSLWVDNFYIDTTRARVEVCDAPTLSQCTIRDIQPTTRWLASGTRISVKLNLALFPPAPQNLYLYVFDATGHANETGFLIRCGNLKTRPQRPRPNPPLK